MKLLLLLLLNVVSNGIIDVILNEDASVTVKMGDNVWTQTPFGESMSVSDVVVGNNEINATVCLSRTKSEYMDIALTLEKNKPEYCIDIKVHEQHFGRKIIQYPYPISPESGEDRMVLAYREGLLVRCSDTYLFGGKLPRTEFSFIDGHNYNMPWWGLENNDGSASMCIVETPYDASIKLRQFDGLWQIHAILHQSMQKYNEHRRLRYVFFEEGNYVSMTTRFRRWAEDNGFVKTLKEKAQEHPVTDLSVGAPTIYIMGDGPQQIDNSHIADYFMRAGVDRAFYYGGGGWWANMSNDCIDYLNSKNYITTRYDILSDFVPEEDEKLLNVNPNWPKGLSVDEASLDSDGNRNRSWPVRSKKGDIYKTYSTCDRVMDKYFAKIDKDLSEKSYTGRFIDVIGAKMPYECYDPDHYANRETQMKARADLLKKLYDKGLAVGTEGGNVFMLKYSHSFEGLRSVHPLTMHAAKKGETVHWMWGKNYLQKDELEMFKVSQRYIVPLWQLTFGDCVVSYPRWNQQHNRFLDEEWVGTHVLYSVLYGQPAMISFPEELWPTYRDDIVSMTAKIYKANEKVRYAKMINHGYLDEDKDVQFAEYDNGVIIYANFSYKTYKNGDIRIGKRDYLIDEKADDNSNEIVQVPLSEIEPGGWLKQQILRDITSGYISIYDELQVSLQGNVFGPKKAKNYSIDKYGNWETRRETWWPGEHEGFFADLLVRNAFLSKYEPWLEKAKETIDYVIENQDSTGYIGIYDEECRLDNLLNENGELWTQSRMLNAILAYYEFTGNKRYLNSVIKSVDYTIDRYQESGKSYFHQPVPNGGGLTHGLMYIETLEWLYRITQDKKYLLFANWLYTDYSSAPSKIKNVDCQLGNLLDREKMLYEHAPHISEHVRAVTWLAKETDDAKLLEAINNLLYKLSRSLSVSSSLITDLKMHESVGGNCSSADLPYEYCSTTELLISLISYMQKFGHYAMGDTIESLMFNAAQGARLPDGKAISYMTFDNRYEATESMGFRYQVAACHKVACCNLNAARIAPYYISNMWTKDGNGLNVMLYGASIIKTIINGVEVEVKEDTDYPFSNRVKFAIDPARKISFEFTLRNPQWSKNTQVYLNGKLVNPQMSDAKISLNREWSKGDILEIVFSDDIVVRKFKNNDYYITKGALIYALPFPENMEKTKDFDKNGLANYDVTLDPGIGITPSDVSAPIDIMSPKRLDEMVFIKNENFNKDFPFDSPYGYVNMPLIINGRETRMDLVPMGSTILRKVSFKN